MPILIEFEYMDGSKEMHQVPAEIWKLNHEDVSKIFVTKKEVKQMTLDPYLETADTELNNNHYPPQQSINRFELFKNSQRSNRTNLMQREKKSKQDKSGTD